MKRKTLPKILIEREEELGHWIKRIAVIKKDCGIKNIKEIDYSGFLMGYAGFLAKHIRRSRIPGGVRECNLMANLQEKSSNLAELNSGEYTHTTLSKAINDFHSAHQKLCDYYLRRK